LSLPLRILAEAIIHRALLYAFDLLELNGKDLRPLPLSRRKDRLARLLAGVQVGIAINEHTDEDGAVLFLHACTAPYRSGPSRDWIKVKSPDSRAMVRFREGRW
jgi:bifunctional non-homologous end joining protein LigD